MANELQIPMKKQSTTLIIDNKPSTKYHEGEIITNQGNELHLLVDNKGAYDIANSYGPSKRTKHMEVRHHYLQHQINNKIIRIKLVPTTQQLADFLTKRVGRKIIQGCYDKYRIPGIIATITNWGGCHTFYTKNNSKLRLSDTGQSYFLCHTFYVGQCSLLIGRIG